MASKESDELRTILFQEYVTATRHYAWAVSELNKQRALVPKDRYQEINRMVEDAHEDCERLRKAIADLGDS
jgi:hypothetical protein